ncbi:ABC transporter [Aureococcus anophagefferens]|uniref:ABC transporter n=1 Tax=Aureococcus anophagefferens TaxID=44056 RepID=A0ABR1G2W5_AURAN
MGKDVADVEVGGRAGVTLEALDLGYVVNGATLVSGVNARFEPGTLTALMGPSGAGKSTLLGLLCGRGGGDVSGAVLVDGAVPPRAAYRRLATLMPQDDELLADLTVRQTLVYAHALRAPAGGDDGRVDGYLERLGLAAASHKRVGGGGAVGISGGQMRRLSAAIEFLSGRPVLLMDEPTSGLDAAAAKDLAAARDEQRTVVATIHQPSWGLFSTFDQVLFLAPGGRAAFAGAPDAAPAYFAAAAPTDGGGNPADAALVALDADPGAWADKWEASREKHDALAKASQFYAASMADAWAGGGGAPAEYDVPLGRQYAVLLGRTARIWVAAPGQALTTYCIVVVVALFCSSLVYDESWSQSKAEMLLFWGFTVFLGCATPAAVYVPLERPFVKREWRNGTYAASAYWAARVSVACASACVAALVTTSIVMGVHGMNAGRPATAAPYALLWHFYAATIVHFAKCTVIGLGIGCAFEKTLGPGLVTAFHVFSLLTSGFLIPGHMMRPAFFYLQKANIFHYYIKIIFCVTLDHADEAAYYLLRSKEFWGVNPGNVRSCYLAELAILVFVVAAGGVACARSLARQDPAPPTRVEVAKPAKDGEYEALEADKATYGGADAGATPVAVAADRLWFWHAADAKGGPDRAAVKDATVVFPGATATALMGPSGAGKSTLLDALGGRVAGETQGRVLVDGAEASPEPGQEKGDSTSLQQLTVGETLHHKALLSLPAGAAPAACARVLASLGLDGKRDVVVGGPDKPSLSGGQKKRLSVAMDLLGDRPVMIIDEPTTGLDAAATLLVAKIITSLSAVERRTVICTIHQPPWAIVETFHRLVVVAGGRPVYGGAPAGLKPFLEGRGRACPPLENPADFVMVELARGGVEPQARAEAAAAVPAVDAAKKTGVAARAGAYALGPADQYLALVRRNVKLWKVDPAQGIAFFTAPLATGTFAALNFHNFGPNVYLGIAVYMISSVPAMSSMGVSVMLVPGERAFVAREFRNGLYSAEAYWAARCTVTLSWVFLCCLSIMPWLYFLLGLPMDLWRVAPCAFGSAVAAATFVAVAMTVGLAVPDKIRVAQVTEPLILVMLTCSGGLVARHRFKDIFIWLYWANPLTYAIQNGWVYFFTHRNSDRDRGYDWVLHHYDAIPENRRFNLAMLVVLLAAAVLNGFRVARSSIHMTMRAS